MSKKIIALTLIMVTLGLVLFTSCYKVTTYIAPTSTEEITTPVSLATDLAPIFAASCSVSGCHNSGGIKPELTAEKLYNTLILSNYVNIEDPENSIIYLSLTGKRATAQMPVGAASNPSNINNLILAWIKQGAQNN